MSNLLEEAQKGREAEQLIEHPVYKEAFANVRAGIINAWAEAPLRDKEGAHELKLMLKLLTDVEMNIKRVVDTGKMATIQLEREQKVADFKAKNKFA